MTPCAVSWCVCLARPDFTRCAAHRLCETLHPEPFDPDELTYVRVIGAGGPDKIEPRCLSCHGSGRCYVCHGTGSHDCDDSRCGHTHECGACGGTGDCDDCDNGAAADGAHEDRPFSLLAPVAYRDDDEKAQWAQRYLRAVYLPVWMPSEVR